MTYREYLKDYFAHITDKDKLKLIAWLCVFPNTTDKTMEELLDEEITESCDELEPCEVKNDYRENNRFA